MNRDIVIETAKRHACFYVYDGDGIRNTARELSNALPDVDMLYSVKCNPHPQILATLAAEGYGADAASSGEVMRAAEAGMAAKDIYYSAPGKTLSDIRSTIGKATIVCDSLGEIERVCEAARMRLSESRTMLASFLPSVRCLDRRSRLIRATPRRCSLCFAASVCALR